MNRCMDQRRRRREGRKNGDKDDDDQDCKLKGRIGQASLPVYAVHSCLGCKLFDRLDGWTECHQDVSLTDPMQPVILQASQRHKKAQEIFYQPVRPTEFVRLSFSD